jgi:hypothetical protein
VTDAALMQRSKAVIVTNHLEKAWPNCAHYIKQSLSDENTFKAKYFMVYSAFVKVVTMQLDKAQVGRAHKRIGETFTLDHDPIVANAYERGHGYADVDDASVRRFVSPFNVKGFGRNQPCAVDAMV